MTASGQDNGHNTQTVDVQEVSDVQEIDISIDQPGTLFEVPSSTSKLYPEDIKGTANKVLDLLGAFPDYLTQAYGEYQKPMTTVGLIIVASLTVAVADGILDRLNNIPLFAPTFELIGLGFAGWFIFRYLLYAESRQELKQEVDVVKDRIVGSIKQLEEGKD